MLAFATDDGLSEFERRLATLARDGIVTQGTVLRHRRLRPRTPRDYMPAQPCLSKDFQPRQPSCSMSNYGPRSAKTNARNGACLCRPGCMHKALSGWMTSSNPLSMCYRVTMRSRRALAPSRCTHCRPAAPLGRGRTSASHRHQPVSFDRSPSMMLRPLPCWIPA